MCKEISEIEKKIKTLYEECVKLRDEILEGKKEIDEIHQSKESEGELYKFYAKNQEAYNFMLSGLQKKRSLYNSKVTKLQELIKLKEIKQFDNQAGKLKETRKVFDEESREVSKLVTKKSKAPVYSGTGEDGPLIVENFQSQSLNAFEALFGEIKKLDESGKYEDIVEYIKKIQGDEKSFLNIEKARLLRLRNAVKESERSPEIIKLLEEQFSVFSEYDSRLRVLKTLYKSLGDKAKKYNESSKLFENQLKQNNTWDVEQEELMIKNFSSIPNEDKFKFIDCRPRPDLLGKILFANKGNDQEVIDYLIKVGDKDPSYANEVLKASLKETLSTYESHELFLRDNPTTTGFASSWIKKSEEGSKFLVGFQKEIAEDLDPLVKLFESAYSKSPESKSPESKSPESKAPESKAPEFSLTQYTLPTEPVAPNPKYIKEKKEYEKKYKQYLKECKKYKKDVEKAKKTEEYKKEAEKIERCERVAIGLIDAFFTKVLIQSKVPKLPKSILILCKEIVSGYLNTKFAKKMDPNDALIAAKQQVISNVFLRVLVPAITTPFNKETGKVEVLKGNSNPMAVCLAKVVQSMANNRLPDNKEYHAIYKYAVSKYKKTIDGFVFALIEMHSK